MTGTQLHQLTLEPTYTDSENKQQTEKRRKENHFLRLRYDIEQTGDRWFECPVIAATLASAFLLTLPTWHFLGSQPPQLWKDLVSVLPEWIWALMLYVPGVMMVVGKYDWLHKWWYGCCISASGAKIAGSVWSGLLLFVILSGIPSFALVLCPMMMYFCCILYLCFRLKCKSMDKAECALSHKNVELRMLG